MTGAGLLLVALAALFEPGDVAATDEAAATSAEQRSAEERSAEEPGFDEPGADVAAPGAFSLRLDPQIVTWLELDTNARRLPSGRLEEDPGHLVPPVDRTAPAPLPVADGLVRAAATLTAEARAPGLLLRSDSAIGLKLFFTQASERMMVAQTRGTLSSARLPGDLVLTLSALAKGRAQLSGVRSYGLTRGDAVVDRPLLPWLALRAGAHGQAFHAFDVPLFSSAGGGALAGARGSFGPEHVDVLFEWGARGFPFAPKDLTDPAQPARRLDGVTTALVQVTSARRLYLSAGYLLVRNGSNARGESWTRHRLSALIGFRLPSELTCTAQGALQITGYDDGVSVGQAYFLGDDEESQNVLEVSLSRPLFGGLFAEARASFMGNELAVEGARFSRQTVAIGLRSQL
jgi:hypothetical protein